jgi:acetyl esterase/lipase
MRKHIRVSGLLAFSVLLGLGTAVALPVAQMAIAPQTVRDDIFPHPPVPFPGGVVALGDVEYSNLVGYRPLLLDLYMPQKSTPKPLVIWIHGGGWNRGDSRTSGPIADYPATLAALAARGYVVASVNYRLSGEAHFPAQIQDVKAAVIFLRANAAKYGIDPARVLLWGGSVGGHLAALAAASCGVAEFNPNLPPDVSPAQPPMPPDCPRFRIACRAR